MHQAQGQKDIAPSVLEQLVQGQVDGSGTRQGASIRQLGQLDWHVGGLNARGEGSSNREGHFQRRLSFVCSIRGTCSVQLFQARLRGTGLRLAGYIYRSRTHQDVDVRVYLFQGALRVINSA